VDKKEIIEKGSQARGYSYKEKRLLDGTVPKRISQ
jgi:hypothetical protein